MKNLRRLVLATSMSVLSSTSFIAFAGDKKDETKNCEVGKKQVHVKDEAACTKKKGKWLTPAPATSAPAAGTTETAPPAGGEKK